ncbi:MAG: hypothetical protein GY702_00035 [Desulfobulbaceae bacterium]|nr:hypothetical protein [Desulfobulbaceae bacterium]
MTLYEYIDLLVQLKSAGNTIWGFLLSVGLGVVAFVSTVGKKFDKMYFIILLIIIGVFSVSNNNALNKNITARYELGCQLSVEYNDYYNDNKAFVNTLSPMGKHKYFTHLYVRKAVLVFHRLLILLIISAVVIAYCKNNE